MVLLVCGVGCREKRCSGPLFDGGRNAHFCLVMVCTSLSRKMKEVEKERQVTGMIVFGYSQG